MAALALRLRLEDFGLGARETPVTPGDLPANPSCSRQSAELLLVDAEKFGRLQIMDASILF